MKNEPFKTYALQQSTTLLIYSERKTIDIEPLYQRASDIWDEEKKQLLIDSLLNNFDIPKLYFHELSGNNKFQYAIIDGKQRLAAIWDFIDNGFPLADDFELLANSSVKARGLTYGELSKKYPSLKLRFDSISLPIVVIATRETELIEDMFSRLNEAVPLNAAEKRNAFGGPLPSRIRTLAKTDFFQDRLPFSNTRYRHYDLAAKFLFFESERELLDTKKAYLDEFVRSFTSATRADRLSKAARSVCDSMSRVFTRKDHLLRSVGMVVLYYFLFHIALREGWASKIARSTLGKFQDLLDTNRATAEKNITKARYELLEFDRLAQSPNDALALNYRFEVLRGFVRSGKVPRISELKHLSKSQ